MYIFSQYFTKCGNYAYIISSFYNNSNKKLPSSGQSGSCILPGNRYLASTIVTDIASIEVIGYSGCFQRNIGNIGVIISTNKFKENQPRAGFPWFICNGGEEKIDKFW